MMFHCVTLACNHRLGIRYPKMNLVLTLLAFFLLHGDVDSSTIDQRNSQQSVVISPVLSRTLSGEDHMSFCIKKSDGERDPDPRFVQFYFAVESSVEPGAQLIKELKDFIHYILHAAIYWCPDYIHGSNSTGDRDTDIPSSQTRIFGKDRGQFSIVEIKTDSIGVMNDCTCNKVRLPETSGDHCNVFGGMLALYTVQGMGESDGLTQNVRNVVRRLFDEGLLLSRALPTVDNIQWIGDSVEVFDCSVPDFMQQEPETGEDSGEDAKIDPLEPFETPSYSNGVVETTKTNSNGENLQAGDGVDPKLFRATGDDQRSGGQVLLVAGGTMILAGIGIFLLVSERRRLSALFRPKRHMMLWDDFFGIPTQVGTGDPPSSYHYGQYHCMLTGARYLSTQCEACLETLQRGGGPGFTSFDVSTANKVVTSVDSPIKSKPAFRSSEAHWDGLPRGAHPWEGITPNDRDVNLTTRNQRYQFKTKKREHQNDWGAKNPSLSQPYNYTDEHTGPRTVSDHGQDTQNGDAFSRSVHSHLSFGRTAVNPFTLMVETGDEAFERGRRSPRHII